MIRKSQWKNSNILFLLPALAFCFLAGCDKPNIAFGTNFVNNNNTNVIEIDTFSTNLSTVQLDSFPTSGTGSLLIGSYKDPYFGDISFRSFLQIAKPTTIPAMTVYSTFDSISLIMRINKTYYGDTTIPQHYYVSQLTENYKLPLPPSPQAFFNTSDIPFNLDPLGSTTVTIKPIADITKSIATKDSIEIRLPDSLGQALMKLMYVKSDIVTNQVSFLNYFNGLCIYSDDASKGAVFGFKDSVSVRLVYHEPGASYTYVNVNFPINNRPYQFNQVKFDRTGTPLSVIPALQAARTNVNVPTDVPSALTNNASYVQSITGIQTKVTFPTIFNLSQQNDYLGILKAVLILKPVAGTYTPLLSVPPQLTLSATNQTNEILSSGLTLGGQVQTGSLVTDYITGQNTAYSYDVTGYITQQIGITGSTNLNGLMLTIPYPANYTTFNRVVLGDKTNKIYNVKLKIYYVSLPH